MRKIVFLLVLILLVLILSFVYQVMSNIIGGPKIYPITYINIGGTQKAICFTPDGKYFYVTHGNNLVSKVNISSNRTVSIIALNGTLTFGGQPVISGGNLYVGTALKNYTLLTWNNGTVVKVQTADLSNWERINHFSGTVETIWTESTVFAINDTNDTIVSAVQVPGEIEEIVPSKGGRFIYILSLNETGLNGNLDTLTYGKSIFTIVDTQTKKVVATFLVGSPAKFGFTTDDMFLDSNGNIYLNGIDTNQTYVFNTSTNAFARNISVNSFKITGSPNGKYIYVIPSLGQALYAINTSTDKIAWQVPFKNSAVLSLAVSPNGKYLYVSIWSKNDTMILNATSGAVVKNIKIRNPFEVTFSSSLEYAYIWPGINTSAVIMLNTITNNEAAHFFIPMSIYSSTAEPFYYQSGNYSYDISLGNKIYVYDSNPNHLIFLVLLNYVLALLNLILIVVVLAVIFKVK